MKKFMKYKKEFTIALLFCLIAMFVNASGETTAWFTDNKVTNQSMKVGTMKLDLTREIFNYSLNLEPGTTYHNYFSKVKNTGSLDGQLRVKIMPKFIFEDFHELGYFYESGLPTDNVIFNFTPEFLGNFTFNVGDGYYYYNGKFQSGQSETIFNSITIDGATTGNEYNVNKNIYLSYQVIAEIRQIPSSERQNTKNITYNIPDSEWQPLVSEATVEGQPIHTEAPSPLEVAVEKIEKIGEEIIITFNQDIDNVDFFVESDGAVSLYDSTTKSGNTIILFISEEAMTTKGEYPLTILSSDMKLLANQTIIIE